MATFGSYCKVFNAPKTDVLFTINKSLKQKILDAKETRNITIKQLENVDPSVNSEKFTVKGRVSIGTDALHDIVTFRGPAKIKRSNRDNEFPSL